MKSGKREANVTEMACAIAQVLLTCRTFARLARGAEARVERSMAIRSAVVLDVVEQSVRNFEDGLVGNVLIRPKQSLVSMATSLVCALLLLLNTKLNALEVLRKLVHQLLLVRSIGGESHGFRPGSGTFQSSMGIRSKRWSRGSTSRSRRRVAIAE